jgi:hypothetical protein
MSRHRHRDNNKLFQPVGLMAAAAAGVGSPSLSEIRLLAHSAPSRVSALSSVTFDCLVPLGFHLEIILEQTLNRDQCDSFGT